MGAVIGDILPLAVGVAISPIPIIAAILMLLSPKARVTSVGFLLGWTAGIVIAATVFTLLSSVMAEGDPEASRPIRGILQLALGVLLLLLAVKEWRARPKEGEEPKLPGWMQAIDKISFFGALGLGLLLSGLNPKNLIMGANAGMTIGGAELGVGPDVVVILVYTLIAACTVLVPVVAYLVAADRLTGALNALRDWLAKENTVIMAVLLLVLGVNTIGKGIASF